MTKNVLVTGCAGFIGYNLSKKFIHQEYSVTGIDSLNTAYDKKFKELRLKDLEKEKNFQFVNNNLSDEDSLNELNNFDIVVFDFENNIVTEYDKGDVFKNRNPNTP